MPSLRGVVLVRSLSSRSGIWRAFFKSLIACLFQGHESGALKSLCTQFPCSASQNLPMLGIPSPPAHGGSWAVSKSTTVFFWYPFFQMKSFTAFCDASQGNRASGPRFASFRRIPTSAVPSSFSFLLKLHQRLVREERDLLHPRQHVRWYM